MWLSVSPLDVRGTCLLTFQCARSFGLSAIRQSSNIFFTNGLYDPFIACGPTKDITDTITAFVFGKPAKFFTTVNNVALDQGP